MSKTQPKTPSLKGIARADRERKRLEAETRNAKYQALPLAHKAVGQGAKVRAKLAQAKEQP